MSKILVTGATGFIGQYAVAELIRRGHTVIASSANPQKARQADWYGQVEYIPFNLAEQPSDADIFSFFGAPDSLIHLAWEGLPDYKGAFHLEENYPRHAAFLENLLAHGLHDLTVIGTCLEYGMQEGKLEEQRPAKPIVAYASAKNRLRIRLEELQTKYSFSLRWVRLFYMYGRGQNPKSLLSQLDKALEAGEKIFNMSGGQQVRDYLPVEKVAAYIVRIAEQRRVQGIINCCSNHPVAVADLVEDYLRRVRKKISLNLGYYPYPDYEPMRFWGDDSKLKIILEDE